MADVPSPGVVMQQRQKVLADLLRRNPAMEATSWDQLRQMRAAAPDQATQETLAPFEHRAFAREQVSEHPEQFLSMMVAPAAYYAAKKLGLSQGRTPPSSDQVFAGMQGATEGAGQAISNALRRWGLMKQQQEQQAAAAPTQLATPMMSAQPGV